VPRLIKKLGPELGFIILSVHDEPAVVDECLAAGQKALRSSEQRLTISFQRWKPCLQVKLRLTVYSNKKARKEKTMKSHLKKALCFLLIAVLWGTGPAWADAKKPNILVIWGDDIGQFNISAYNLGMMGYKTPNIDRLAGRRTVHGLVRPAELHRRSSSIRNRPVAHPHRSHQGRSTRCTRGHEEGGPDDCHALEGAGIRHRPVRQEPPGRPR